MQRLSYPSVNVGPSFKYIDPVTVVSCRPPFSFVLHLRIVYRGPDWHIFIPQGLISGSVQIFFAWRIRVLSTNLIVFAVIVILALPQFGTPAISGFPRIAPLVGF